ncbi:hypothetical protein PVAP13_4KG378800 [Panicum virgatum]|uniref:Uncharacterized protein n=1 Tax=Panicum virgatum TaxID=38727 RepID=A0A8T0TYF9_PANVG|nr:hypothetical protein PVAP13_4KG378800 [Panicum virgatum]
MLAHRRSRPPAPFTTVSVELTTVVTRSQSPAIKIPSMTMQNKAAARRGATCSSSMTTRAHFIVQDHPRADHVFVRSSWPEMATRREENTRMLGSMEAGSHAAPLTKPLTVATP